MVMCGIFGVLSLSKINTKYLNSLSLNLFKLSESGKDACGIFSIHKLRVPVIKSNTKVTNLIKTNNFYNLWDQI